MSPCVSRRIVGGLLCLAPLVLGATMESQSASPDPSATARLIQRHYDGVRAFVHTYTGGVLRKTIVERGTVQFKKPGMMRWLYTVPERKEFVSDGVRMYAYVPEDRQVTVSAMPTGDRATTPTLFLTGRGDLTRDFVAAQAPEGTAVPPGAIAITLTPRTPEADFDWMTLVTDRVTGQIRGLITADAQGGRSAFVFERVRENTGVGDKEFRFSIPRGVDVITNNQIDR